MSQEGQVVEPQLVSHLAAAVSERTATSLWRTHLERVSVPLGMRFVVDTVNTARTSKIAQRTFENSTAVGRSSIDRLYNCVYVWPFTVLVFEQGESMKF